MDGYEEGTVIVGRYRVGKTLGQGGMGMVLAAHDERMDRPVALKFLLPALREKPNVVARFEREGRSAAKIDDEHVARVYNVESTADGVPFIVMEQLRGETLAKLIETRGRLSIAEAVDFALQVCEALVQAHKLGIIHRDLKPQNLFLTQTAYGAHLLKVLDFGISKTVGKDESALTRTGGVVGSPAYMAPEQLRGEEVDERADVWALAVVIYHMAAGVPPFRGEVAVVGHAILQGEYDALSTHRADVPEGFEDALSQALVVHLPSRLPSVAALAAKLAPFGSEKARESYARIQAMVSPAPPAEAPKEPASPPPQLPPAAMTSADRSTSISEDTPVVSPPRPARSPRRTLPAALAVAGGMALVVALVRFSTPNAMPIAPAPSAIPAPSGSAAKESVEEPLKRECAAGSGESCNRLGLRYENGTGVAQDDLQAFEAYDKGCRAGHAAACANLGSRYYEGKGVAKDEATGRQMFLRGCEGGEPLGCVRYGMAYRDGKGGPKDADKAYEYFEQACNAGALLGCTERALENLRGEGKHKDAKWGLEQLDSVCTRGEPTACIRAAGFRAKGVGSAAPADMGRAREALSKGCKADAGLACKAGKLVDTEVGTRSTEAKMKASYRAQCDAGGTVFCRLLGNVLLMGTPAEREEGKRVLGKACSAGDIPSCDVLKRAGAQ